MLVCATTSRKVPPLKGTTITKQRFYVNAVLLQTVVSGHLKYLCTSGKPSIRLLMLSLFFNPSNFTDILPLCSCFTIGSLQSAPVVINSQLLVEIFCPIQWYIFSQFQERFQCKQDILDAVYILSHLFPVKPGKQWQTAFIKGREVSSKSVDTSCVVCPSKQVPPFKQTKSKHGCGTANRNMRIF